MLENTTVTASEAGVATLTTHMRCWAQVVLIPVGAVSGTLSITGRYAGGESFVPIEEDGAALEGIVLSAEYARVLPDCRFAEIRATSTNSADSFKLAVSV